MTGTLCNQSSGHIRTDWRGGDGGEDNPAVACEEDDGLGEKDADGVAGDGGTDSKDGCSGEREDMGSLIGRTGESATDGRGVSRTELEGPG